MAGRTVDVVLVVAAIVCGAALVAPTSQVGGMLAHTHMCVCV